MFMESFPNLRRPVAVQARQLGQVSQWGDHLLGWWQLCMHQLLP